MKKLFRFVILFIAFLSLMISICLAYEEEIKNLTNDLAQKIIYSKKKVIAVVDFTDLQGNVTELGRFLAEELSISLAASDNEFEVVDRNHLKSLLQEYKLSLSGLIDPSTAKKVGQISGTDALITGTVTPFGDTIRLGVKVINTSTAKIITAATVNIAKTKAIEDLFNNSIGASKDFSQDSSETFDKVSPKKEFGLVGYWGLDELDGVTVKDLTENGNDGIVCGGPQLVSGKIGKALKFDGNDDYVRIYNLVSNDFTISFWLKTTQVASNSESWYWGVGLVDGETRGIDGDFGVNLVGDKLGFGITAETVTSNSSINDGIWHLCTVTRDKKRGVIKIFIDGKVENAGIFEGVESLTTSKYLTFGSLLTGENFYRGILDEIRIYNRVLSDKEIVELFRRQQ